MAALGSRIDSRMTAPVPADVAQVGTDDLATAFADDGSWRQRRSGASLERCGGPLPDLALPATGHRDVSSRHRLRQGGGGGGEKARTQQGANGIAAHSA